MKTAMQLKSASIAKTGSDDSSIINAKTTLISVLHIVNQSDRRDISATWNVLPKEEKNSALFR